ncbi:MAG: NAD-dependent epimerase/dehydratase family protein [Bacteroidetes bacterium]|nr:NAD-dependent epimerase/dehydratase family protein [Bacteroidota bacterium]
MILVTGATGLVGSHLLYELLSKGEKVKALKRQSSDTNRVLKTLGYYTGEPENLFSGIEWINGDVTDRESLDPAFLDVDKVYHAAGMISMDPADRAEMARINIEGTANIVNLCVEKKIRKLCHVSSVAAFGHRVPPVVVDENVSWKAGTHKLTYRVTKFNAEMEVWRGMAEGLEAVIVNPSIIIGPGDWRKGSPAMFDRVAKGLKFYTHGVTGYVDVRDVAKAMILLMESSEKEEHFILNSENLSFQELFEMIAIELNKPVPSIAATRFMTGLAWRLDYARKKLLGGTSLITREAVASAHKETLYSNEKVRKALGIDFIPIRESVMNTVRCYCESGAKKAEGGRRKAEGTRRKAQDARHKAEGKK